MSLQIKLIVLGNQHVGKTTFIKKMKDDIFINYYLSTIGVDYDRIVFKYEDKEHEIILWDTSGQDKFNFIINSYFNSVTGAIILCDVNDFTSFTQAKKWIEEFRIRKDNLNIPILFLANKIDIKNRVVLAEDIEAVGKEYNVKTMEISIKDNINLDKIFPTIIDEYNEKLDKNLISFKKDNIRRLKRKNSSFQLIEPKEPEPRCCNIM